MKKALSISVMILLISLSATAQQQIKKGRWFISHSIGGFEYSSSRTKEYNGVGARVDDIKDSRFGFYSSFTGPDYGDIEISSRDYVANNIDSKINRIAITLQPVAGIFINDNLLLGASVLLNIENTKQERNDIFYEAKTKTSEVGIGPLVRYYFGGTEKARFFAGLETRYTFANYDDVTVSTNAANTVRQSYDTDWRTLMVKPHIGYAWFAGKRWSFELRADYLYESEKRDDVFSYQMNGLMQPGYPRLSSHDQKTNRVSLNAGIGFSI